MAENDLLKRYLDAGVAFTDMTRKKAEAIVKDLIKSGEVQREQAQDRVEDLLERSRRSSESLVGLIRTEVRQQLATMGVATRDDLARLASRLGVRVNVARPAAKAKSAGSSAAKTAAKKTGSAKKAATKKATGAKKAATKKATAAKKTATKKTTAAKKTAGAKKTATKKTAGAKKAPAKAAKKA
jgi:polyhydroxyalkanoate synthesis regulator phasin